MSIDRTGSAVRTQAALNEIEEFEGEEEVDGDEEVDPVIVETDVSEFEPQGPLIASNPFQAAAPLNPPPSGLPARLAAQVFAAPAGPERARLMERLKLPADVQVLVNPMPAVDDDYTLEQADADAKTVYDATDGGLTGWGTDEDALWRTLEGKTAAQLNRLREAYQAHYGKALDEVVTGELSGEDAARAVIALSGKSKSTRSKEPGESARSSPESSAKRLYEAIDGLGTDEDAIRAELKGKSKAEIDAIAVAYRQKYGADLRADLDSDLGGRDSVELLHQLFDRGDVDPNSSNANQERLDRIREQHEAEGGFGLTNLIQTLTKGGTETDEYRYSQNVEAAQAALDQGGSPQSERLVRFATGDLDSLQHAKDTSAELAGEAAAMVGAGTAVALTSGALAVPLVAAVGAAAGAASGATAYAAAAGNSAEAGDVARHAATGAVSGALFAAAPGVSLLGKGAATTARASTLTRDIAGWGRVGVYSGAADGAVRTSLHDETWQGDDGVSRVLQGTLTGAAMGGVLGGAMGGALGAAGRGLARSSGASREAAGATTNVPPPAGQTVASHNPIAGTANLPAQPLLGGTPAVPASTRAAQPAFANTATRGAQTAAGRRPPASNAGQPTRSAPPAADHNAPASNAPTATPNPRASHATPVAGDHTPASNATPAAGHSPPVRTTPTAASATPLKYEVAASGPWPVLRRPDLEGVLPTRRSGWSARTHPFRDPSFVNLSPGVRGGKAFWRPIHFDRVKDPAVLGHVGNERMWTTARQYGLEGIRFLRGNSAEAILRARHRGVVMDTPNGQAAAHTNMGLAEAETGSVSGGHGHNEDAVFLDHIPGSNGSSGVTVLGAADQATNAGRVHKAANGAGSRTAAEEILGSMRSHPDADLTAALRTALRAGDRKVFDAFNARSATNPTGKVATASTAAVAAIRDGVLHGAAVGDATVLVFRADGTLKLRVGGDRKLVGGESGLEGYVGRGNLKDEDIDVDSVRLEEGDVTLTFTDGVANARGDSDAMVEHVIGDLGAIVQYARSQGLGAQEIVEFSRNHAMNSVWDRQVASDNLGISAHVYSPASGA